MIIENTNFKGHLADFRSSMMSTFFHITEATEITKYELVQKYIKLLAQGYIKGKTRSKKAQKVRESISRTFYDI